MQNFKNYKPHVIVGASFIIFALLLFSVKIYSNNKSQVISQPQETNNEQNDNSLFKLSSIPETPQDLLKQQMDLKTFENEQDLRDFLEKSYEHEYVSFRPTEEFVLRDTASAVSMDNSMAIDGWGGGPKMENSTNYSKTNVQVEGIDEGDIVKTDGEYIYTLSKGDLFIIKAYPTDKAEIISKIDFNENINTQELLIHNNSLIVLGNAYSYYHDDSRPFEETELYQSIQRYPSFTTVKVFDITDKNKPTIQKEIDIEGNYNTARIVNNNLYLASSFYGYQVYDDITPLPVILEDKNVMPQSIGGKDCLDCTKVHYTLSPYANKSFVTLASLQLEETKDSELFDFDHEVFLIDSNITLFASFDNIYLSHAQHLNERILLVYAMKEVLWDKLTQHEIERIQKIENTEDFILSQTEKFNKISLILDQYVLKQSLDVQKQLRKDITNALNNQYTQLEKELEKTIIHKIAIQNGDLLYDGVTSVPGLILNQFSFDEKNGYLRVATTTGNRWNPFRRENNIVQKNHLYIVGPNLEITGKVEDLAPTERIYAVRYIGDMAYVVTFEEVDPLFVIDLSDNTNPVVKGELKIPGFSNYLHPYDENTLIGIGRETKMDEKDRLTIQGIKLSLFDVKDIENPKELDTYIIGTQDEYVSSPALYNHKAVLFSKDKNLLSIPIEISGKTYNEYDRYINYNGAYVFNINREDGFTYKTAINHYDDFDQEYFWENGYNYYNTTVIRSLFIEDSLYTLSSKYLKSHDLDDLETENFSLQLQKEKSPAEKPDFEVIN